MTDINRRDGITVLINLHTPDTARTYCRRIIFGGAPERLTEGVLREIHGQTGHETLSERMTSTSLLSPALAAAAAV